MPGALDGIRVIDFGQYVAGPLAGMLLADQGADVIRVDPPGGPRLKTPANSTWNRGKRSIVLDLKDPADLETARSLIAGADVLLENFRPGVMQRLGLGPDDMGKANPQLVYCSIPGFATDDPRVNLRAFEGVVGAAAATYVPGVKVQTRLSPFTPPFPSPPATPRSSPWSASRWPSTPASATAWASISRCPCSTPCSPPSAGAA